MFLSLTSFLSFHEFQYSRPAIKTVVALSFSPRQISKEQKREERNNYHHIARSITYIHQGKEKMEKASMSTSYHPDFSSADAIVFVLYNIFHWVASLHKLSFGFLCLLHVRKSQACLESTSSTNLTTSKGSELELSREDLEMVMQKMGISEETKRGKQIKEKIAFDDVLDIFEEKEPSLEEAREAFSVFDRDSDGFIDASELQRVLSELGFKAEVGLDECQGMIEAYDENKDGRIDFNEFLKFLELSFC